MINKNIEWINSLRVLASFSVILLHVAAVILYQYGNISNFDWWIGNIYDGSVRFCVPIFLMISGTLILSKTYESIGDYLRKRVLRIIFPFLFWSSIYILKDLITKLNYGETLSFKGVLNYIFVQLKTGASFHLWYIYLLIGLYLFFPILGKWLHKSNNHEIQYFLVIWAITILANIPIIKNLIPQLDISYFSGYIGLPILGYYLSKTVFNFKYKKVIYTLMILSGISITIFGTYFMTKQNGEFFDGFYNYLTFNVILTSIGVFLLFRDSEMHNSRFIIFANKYSYGTYLVHILVLIVLGKFGISYNFVNPIIGIPITSILCFIISILIIFGLNKLPFGKYISG